MYQYASEFNVVKCLAIGSLASPTILTVNIYYFGEVRNPQNLIYLFLSVLFFSAIITLVVGYCGYILTEQINPSLLSSVYYFPILGGIFGAIFGLIIRDSDNKSIIYFTFLAFTNGILTSLELKRQKNKCG